MKDEPRTLVVLPTLDEAANLRPMVEALQRVVPGVEILVIDDRSTDGTAEIARELRDADARVHLIERPGRLGLGTAYRDGFRWALERDYDRIVQMDADQSHDPEAVPDLLAALDEVDVAIGSRYVSGGGADHWPLHRRLLSRGASRYVRWVLGVPVADVMGGFRAYRREALERIAPDDIQATGYLVQGEVTCRAHRAGLRLRELPITFRDRTHGASKMNAAVIREALLRVWALRRSI